MLVLISGWLPAQKPEHCDCFVKGTVKDRETGQPIAGAILAVRRTPQFATTDAEGRYHLKNLCQGDYVVECRIVGYKLTTTKISLQHSAEENLNLSEEEVHLQDVEITARRVWSLSQKPTTLESDALDQARGQTLGDALKNITGVTMLQTGATIAKPVIHGLHSNRVLIMNNGLRQEGQQWGSEHAPEIDPFVAKRLSVVKGAAGVRYGSDAVGGVILVEPDDLPTQKGTNGELNTVAFSNGRMGVLSGTLQGGFSHWRGAGWRVQGTLKNGGNIQTPDYFLANTGAREQNFSAAIGYRNAQRGAEIFYSRFQTNIGIFSGAHIGSTTDLLNVIRNGEPFIKSDFTRQIERPNQDISHDLLKIKAFWMIRGSRLQLTAGRQFNYRGEWDLHGPQAALRPSLRFRISTYSSELVWEHKPTRQKITGQIGLSGLYQRNTTGGRPLIPDFEQLNAGIFAIERLVQDKWEWEAGLRYDWRWMWVSEFVGRILTPQNLHFSSVSGTVGAVFNASESLAFRTNFGTAWRPPNVNELYSRGVHHGAATFEEGDANLSPETAYNFMTSAEYHTTHWHVEVGMYRNLIDNYIYAQPQPEPVLTIRGAFPYFKYTQTRATFTGLDLNSTWDVTPKLQHTTKLSYLRAYDQAQNDYLVLIPANRVENTLLYNFGTIWKSGNTQASVGHLWVDKQRRVPPNSDFMPPPAAYHLWSVQLSGEITLTEKQQLKWGLSAQNLLDTAYRDYLNRFRYFSLEQGRNLSVRIKYIF
ncbi:MAG: TonB-dependent receptor [Spirosomaceae bacterium]|nr:TonB-dependent receptor [Spirosomataceae bacterium]